jgi:hypothetical protein
MEAPDTERKPGGWFAGNLSRLAPRIENLLDVSNGVSN